MNKLSIASSVVAAVMIILQACASSCPVMSKASSPEEQKVCALAGAWVDHFIKKSATGLARHYSDDAVIISAALGGKTMDSQSYEKKMKESFLTMDMGGAVCSNKILEIRKINDTIVSVKIAMTVKGKKGLRANYTNLLTWSLTSQGWRIIRQVPTE
jgi:ketosteroid isomerase-like protein